MTKTVQDGIAIVILPSTLWILEYHSVNEKYAARLDLMMMWEGPVHLLLGQRVVDPGRRRF